MNYLLDTNILLTYIRSKEQREIIESQYKIFSLNTPIISVVTVGEIESIGLRNHWGDRRFDILDKLLDRIIITDINSEDVIQKYAEIDTYSQNKLIGSPLKNTSRNMGKNDLWIAATASVINATLITTDQDFSHLSDRYFPLKLIKIP
ncbi:MAG: type II toxin-antitoxin system VapC family toxin [Saprospiraceae bacterium]